ncbi:MAG: hypothetical protein ACI9Y1_002227 [Lentisphaeria bacterium]|jgi:hypothetical protein
MIALRACSICLFALVSSLGYAEVNLQPVSLQTSTAPGFYTANETLKIYLPSGLPLSIANALSLELDNIDVSALARLNTSQLTYTPIQRLKHGRHALRLVHYTADGSVTEFGFWEIYVRQSERFADARLKTQIDAGASQVLADKNTSDAASYAASSTSNSASNYSAQGSAQLRASLAQDEWQIRSNADLAYADDENLSLTRRRADIATFSIVADGGPYSLHLGDQTIGQANLVDDGFQRRGLSTRAQVSSLASSITAYSVSSNQRVGIDGGLGIDSRDNRVSGINWSYHALHSERSTVVVSSSYLAGRLSQQDYGTLEFDTFLAPQEPVIYDGEAANIALDSQFFTQQLRIRLEGARSRYDFDGRDFGFEANSDQAWSALVFYQPTPALQTSALVWNAGFEAQKIGTFYKSLTNIYQPTDTYLERVFTSVARNGWFWDGNYAVESNNLNDNIDYATVNKTQWSLSGGYGAFDTPAPGSLFAILGQPSYNWSLSSLAFKDEYTPVGYYQNDTTTRSVAVNAAFAHQSWQWSLGFTRDDLVDESGWQPDTITRALLLNTGIQLGQYYFIGGGWQLQQTRYQAEAVTTDRQLYSLDARAECIPNRLFASISVGVNQTNAANDPFFALRDQSTYTSGNIQWRIREVKQNRAGLDLTFSITQNRYSNRLSTIDSSPIESNDGYNALITLSTSLPSVFPGGMQ